MHCEWCGQECRGRWPLENRDDDRTGLFVWVCDECREAVQGEYWCEVLCSPIGFRMYPERPATVEVRLLTAWAESVFSPREERGA
jgi:hypothetical protein